MKIKRKHKKFVIIALLSMIIGYVIVNTQPQIDIWSAVVSEDEPRFSIDMPDGARHSPGELNFDNKIFKTFSVSSYENNIEYLLNVTDFQEIITSSSVQNIFHKSLDSIINLDNQILESYKDFGDSVNFKIISKDGGKSKQGKMIFRNGYLFLQLISFREENFDEETYNKFIDSLSLQK